jgi:hypothetical protein
MVPLKPGNAGGGKDPHFRSAFEGAKERGLAMSLQTPEKIRTLQRKLYRKANEEPESGCPSSTLLKNDTADRSSPLELHGHYYVSIIQLP